MLNLSTYSALKKVEEVLGQALVIVSFLMYYIPNSFLVEFSGCTASQNNTLGSCLEAIDGITNGSPNYWYVNGLPAYAIFELTEERKMNSLVLMSGWSTTANYSRPTSFKVKVKVGGQWIQLSGLQVKEDLTAQIENDGTVTLTSGINYLTLEFTTVTDVQSIFLYVTETDPSPNSPSVSWYLRLREIIPGFIGKF